MRRWRDGRLKAGLDELWMIGYDGPRPYPASAWPLIREYAMKFGANY